MSEFTRQLRSSSTSAASWSIESRNTPGMDATSSRTPAPGFTNTGYTRSPGSTRVSRTNARTAGFARMRRGR